MEFSSAIEGKTVQVASSKPPDEKRDELDHPQQSTLNWVFKWVSCVYIINFTVILNKHQFSQPSTSKEIIK